MVPRENNTSVPNFEDWKKRTQTLENLASYRESDASFTAKGEPGWLEFAWVYGDFFNLLGRRPMLGRTFSADDPDTHEGVLSDRLWRWQFGGSPDVIGQTVKLGGSDFQVVGVMPEGFAFPSEETLLWAPAAALPNWQARRNERSSGFGPAIARLRPGATLDQARAEMTLSTASLWRDIHAKTKTAVSALCHSRHRSTARQFHSCSQSCPGRSSWCC
jgi:hypothetical protein